ncbi:hypothetical protein MKX08_003080 [Trichoderma sp. CBMAI-0020]|nr:hypothetical protein MKX08_003080 [Trichoderma sp. CBMAI-0020]
MEGVRRAKRVPASKATERIHGRAEGDRRWSGRRQDDQGLKGSAEAASAARAPEKPQSTGACGFGMCLRTEDVNVTFCCEPGLHALFTPFSSQPSALSIHQVCALPER